MVHPWCSLPSYDMMMRFRYARCWHATHVLLLSARSDADARELICSLILLEFVVSLLVVVFGATAAKGGGVRKVPPSLAVAAYRLHPGYRSRAFSSSSTGIQGGYREGLIRLCWPGTLMLCKGRCSSPGQTALSLLNVPEIRGHGRAWGKDAFC